MEKAFGGEWTKGDRGVPILGIQTSASAAAVSNGQYTPIQIDELGQVRVAAAVTIGANSSVNISQIGGQTAATGGSGILSVALGGTSTVALASGAAVIGALTANQTINLAQVGGNTAATGGAGILSINNQLLAGQAVATGGTGVQSVNILLGSTSLSTAAGGVLQVAANNNQVGGQTLATGGVGRQLVSSDIFQVGAVAAATAGAGILKVGADLFQVGGSATVTASAGVQKVQTVTVMETRNIFASGLAQIPKYAIISASAAGTADVIASAASTSYIILAYNLMTNSSCTAQFFSNSIAMSGKIPMPSGGFGKVCPFSPVGWMTASAANNVKINLSAAAEVTGEIVYIAI